VCSHFIGLDWPALLSFCGNGVYFKILIIGFPLHTVLQVIKPPQQIAMTCVDSLKRNLSLFSILASVGDI
jgi:hypothetical protein